MAVFLLSGIAFLVITNSTFASPLQPELGVLMVQPSTSILRLVEPSTSIMRFECLGHACGGRNESWITGYLAFDGKRLALRCASYSSRAEANRKLQDRLQDAVKIHEVGTNYNQQGQTVGKRAVAFFLYDDKETVAILWTKQKFGICD